jgi:hypothetical protein
MKTKKEEKEGERRRNKEKEGETTRNICRKQLTIHYGLKISWPFGVCVPIPDKMDDADLSYACTAPTVANKVLLSTSQTIDFLRPQYLQLLKQNLRGAARLCFWRANARASEVTLGRGKAGVCPSGSLKISLIYFLRGGCSSCWACDRDGHATADDLFYSRIRHADGAPSCRPWMASCLVLQLSIY